MNCRGKRVQNFNEKIKTQAMLAESTNHWAWAAILWARVGEKNNAKMCETIIQAAAENDKIKFAEMKPIILSNIGG